MHEFPARLRNRPLITPVTVILALLVLIAAYFLVRRFVFGLGEVTHLNAGYPWGLWVTWDIVIGSALGCGGFALAILIYVFNQGRYHRLMRPAILTSLFGYALAGLAAVIDMGRWWQFYNIFLPWHWNFHSVMLEIGLCVAAYTIILVFEFFPMLLERLGLSRLRRAIQAIMWLIIALGILLPMMHQSSLGTMLLVLGHKLSPLYNSPWLPLFFVGAAVTMGYALVVIEATAVTRGFQLPSEHALLSRLSRVVGWIVAGWLLLRFADLIWRGALTDAFQPGLVAASFWLENGFAVAAALIFLSGRARASEILTFLGGVSLLLFGILYRLNAYLIAYQPAVEGYRYFPSAPEVLVTLGLIALEILLYLFFIKLFPVLSLPRPRQGAPA